MRICRAEGNYDVDEASIASASVPEGKSLTVQSSKDESDINVIVRQFGVTGLVPQNVRLPLEADFIDVLDYHSAMRAVRAADESFARLPASVRTRFDNDAGLFADFCVDPANIDELRKLGLAVPAVEPVSASSPPTSPP
ncbi:MAG: internal scaffolding protein [Microvirus sp.]|nr:MAG: internal scaffolding protein [Microvirus sp.]